MGNLRFINEAARMHHLEAAAREATFKLVYCPHLFGTAHRLLAADAYQVLEDAIYEQTKAGTDTGPLQAIDASFEVATDQPEVLLIPDIEAYLNLAGWSTPSNAMY